MIYTKFGTYVRHLYTVLLLTLEKSRSKFKVIVVGDGGQVERVRRGGGHVPPPKIQEKIFFGQLLCKIRAFFVQIIM